MPDLYVPNTAERIQAQEAYVRYLTGAVILHNPEDLYAVHRRDINIESQLEEMVVYAEHLMLMGLQGVIRFAHSKEDRQNLGELEQRFDEAIPHMHDTVERTYASERERLDSLSPALWLIRPAPMADCSIYKKICHSRREKLKTARLIDDLSLHPKLVGFVKGRTLAGANGLEN